MAADFNAILPAGVEPQAVEFSSDVPTIRNSSISGRTFVRQFGGHHWKFKIVLPALTHEQWQKVSAFLISKRGGYSTFTISLPFINRIQTTAVKSPDDGTTFTSGSHAVGTRTGISLSMSTQSDSAARAMRTGDFIRFSNHDKVYQITSGNESFTNASPTQTISIEPGLKTALSSTTSVSDGGNREVYFTVRQTGDVIRFDTDHERLFRFEFDVEED
jgi:hypothetical protein